MKTLVTGLLLIVCSVGSDISSATPPKVPAPGFTLKSNSGDNLKLAEQRGQVIMLNFWASWCGPCRQEMPLLETLYQQYKDLGFTIWGINVDEDSSKARQLLHDTHVSFPILYDPQNKVPALYDLEAMPSTYMIDRDGNIRFAHRGYLPGYEKNYEAQIKQLVME